MTALLGVDNLPSVDTFEFVANFFVDALADQIRGGAQGVADGFGAGAAVAGGRGDLRPVRPALRGSGGGGGGGWVVEGVGGGGGWVVEGVGGDGKGARSSTIGSIFGGKTVKTTLHLAHFTLEPNGFTLDSSSL